MLVPGYASWGAGSVRTKLSNFEELVGIPTNDTAA